MKQLKHILLLAGIISLASCSFLDMEPQDFLAPSQYYSDGSNHINFITNRRNTT